MNTDSESNLPKDPNLVLAIPKPLFVPISRSEHACSVTSVLSDSLRPYRLYPTRLLCPWDAPGKNTGLGCHALLQGIFPTQGSSRPRDLPDPGIKPVFPTSSALQADSLSTEPPGKPLSRSTRNCGHMGRLSRRDQHNDEWRRARHSS